MLYIPFLILLAWYMEVMAPVTSSEKSFITLCVIGFVVSHGLSHVTNFMHNHEYQQLSRRALFSRPFLRTVLPQLFLFYLVGTSFSLETSDVAVYVVVLVIIGKTLMDTELHIWEHKRFWVG